MGCRRRLHLLMHQSNDARSLESVYYISDVNKVRLGRTASSAAGLTQLSVLFPACERQTEKSQGPIYKISYYCRKIILSFSQDRLTIVTYNVLRLLLVTISGDFVGKSYLKSLAFFVRCFYRAMLCIRGTSHGPVSVRPSVRLSVRHKSVFY